MTMLEQMKRHIPEPYPYMYQDGYTPYEILEATSNKIYNDHLARKKEAESFIVPTINFKSTVKVIK